ncbi:hypothetical protein THASP1DRAFT_24206 [Thamnocephalis sphaerospora]|uniref:Uncharacterized protein n=1 Tax=Thamnocephalis sphaerospora TaxID=78915 RepID=A0A4P9XNY1_9FUNG|nr:hypothetical protein THASP1DRAFT_24206 [Thamnocephalis sphaerospora]|eukprot:RKP07684.1 hypothetical protein THASP1DRAFT_24206 [Thamnocephalis sphaerospora]
MAQASGRASMPGTNATDDLKLRNMSEWHTFITDDSKRDAAPRGTSAPPPSQQLGSESEKPASIPSTAAATPRGLSAASSSKMTTSSAESSPGLQRPSSLRSVTSDKQNGRSAGNRAYIRIYFDICTDIHTSIDGKHYSISTFGIAACQLE